MQEQKDSGGTHHGGGHPKDVGGGGHGGGSDGAEARGVHKEAGHHGEVRKYLDTDQSKQPATRCIAKFASANSSVSDPSLEFVNGSSNSSKGNKFLLFRPNRTVFKTHRPLSSRKDAYLSIYLSISLVGF